MSEEQDEKDFVEWKRNKWPIAIYGQNWTRDHDSWMLIAFTEGRRTLREKEKKDG